MKTQENRRPLVAQNTQSGSGIDRARLPRDHDAISKLGFADCLVLSSASKLPVELGFPAAGHARLVISPWSVTMVTLAS